MNIKIQRNRMSWIKKSADVEVSKELAYDNQGITKTDAYEVEITDAYLQESRTEGSKSISLVIGIKNENEETNRTYFTIVGKDGETFFKTTVKGKEVKRQHFGLSIVNTLFGIVLDKEIFDIEPTDIKYERWDKETKALVEEKGDGFPDLIGKKVGACVQMNREIDGNNSKEFANIAHFFDLKTGLFFEEEDSDRRKLDRWIAGAKDFIIKEVEQKQSSFGKKKETANGEAPKSRWGK